MGWKLKLLAFAFLALAISYRAWLIVIPLSLYLLWSTLFRRGKPPEAYPARVREASAKGQKWKISKMQVAGFFILTLALIGYARGGLYAPTVLSLVGALLILWRRIPGAALFWTLYPVNESILLRRKYLPFSWYVIAEVKLATKQVPKILSGINHQILVITSTSPAILLAIHTPALSSKGAEKKAILKLRESAKALGPLGAYLLPLDSGKALAQLPRSLRRVNLELPRWLWSLPTTPFDLLAISAKNGFVKSLGVYRKESLKGPTGLDPILPPANQTLEKPALVWEILKILENKISWPNPDGYTAFLSSIFATQDSEIGERLQEEGSQGTRTDVSIQSLASPPVELSRVQLRAIMRQYALRYI